jgi:hypothetical protein
LSQSHIRNARLFINRKIDEALPFQARAWKTVPI